MREHHSPSVVIKTCYSQTSNLKYCRKNRNILLLKSTLIYIIQFSSLTLDNQKPAVHIHGLIKKKKKGIFAENTIHCLVQPTPYSICNSSSDDLVQKPTPASRTIVFISRNQADHLYIYIAYWTGWLDHNKHNPLYIESSPYLSVLSIT